MIYYGKDSRDEAHQRSSVLAMIQLESICLHPRLNLADADYDLLSKTASVVRLTVSIDLGVVCIRVWREMMTLDELQQVGSVQLKQDRSKDRTLRDSKSRLLMASNWTSLCELVVFGP